MRQEMIIVCLFKQMTAYEVRISDWSSDVCSSDLPFVRGVLVDDDEAVLGFGDDIGFRNLAARDAKRVRFGTRDRHGRGFGAAHRECTRPRETADAVVQPPGGPRLRGAAHGRRWALPRRNTNGSASCREWACQHL